MVQISDEHLSRELSRTKRWSELDYESVNSVAKLKREDVVDFLDPSRRIQAFSVLRRTEAYRRLLDASAPMVLEVGLELAHELPGRDVPNTVSGRTRS